MTPRGLRSVSGSNGAHKTALSYVQIKWQNNISAQKIKTLLFSSDERKKTGVLRGYCRVKGPNHILGLGREHQ